MKLLYMCLVGYVCIELALQLRTKPSWCATKCKICKPKCKSCKPIPNVVCPKPVKSVKSTSLIDRLTSPYSTQCIRVICASVLCNMVVVIICSVCMCYRYNMPINSNDIKK